MTLKLVVLASLVFSVDAGAPLCPELIIQGDPIHLGDTRNDEWLECSPQVPSTPYGECYSLQFNITTEQADWLTLLLIKSSAASADTTGKVFLDGQFVGFLASATLGSRCDFQESFYDIALDPGPHEIQVCTSIYSFQHRTELDDFAFHDVRLSCALDKPELLTWGQVKSMYE